MTTIVNKQPIELVSWSPFGNWNFASPSTDCSICRILLVKACAECESKNSKEDLSCDISRGNCGHCYHKHCINNWLKTSTHCPICKLPFNITVSNMNNDTDWRRLLLKR